MVALLNSESASQFSAGQTAKVDQRKNDYERRNKQKPGATTGFLSVIVVVVVAGHHRLAYRLLGELENTGGRLSSASASQNNQYRSVHAHTVTALGRT